MKFAWALAALCMTGGAAAQTAYPVFEDVDANQDGKLTSDECAVIAGLEFAYADANQDGTLDRQEYLAATKDIEVDRVLVGFEAQGRASTSPFG